MATLRDLAASRLNSPTPHLWWILGAAASVGSLLALRYSGSSLSAKEPQTIPSPRDAVLQLLERDQHARLPYPPDALPGARDVSSPYGSIRVYEWGPESGEKVLLIHGISTPSIALASLARKLVAKGCRVMLFDLFSRGYSSGPSPHTHRYDSALYTSQILLCLSSSPLHWSQFTLIGYSLGGAIAADFTSYMPHLIANLVLVAPGGLIRTSHITWKSRMLYSTSGIVPEGLVERLVAQRLWSGPETARSIEPEPDVQAEAGEKGGLRTAAVYASSTFTLLPEHPQCTASNVVDWQILHHKGFVPAFISSIRYAPVHDQHHRWRALGENVAMQRGPLKKVHLVLGETDPIIVVDEVIEDAQAALGQDNAVFHVIKGAGHNVAFENAEDIARIVEAMLVQPGDAA
ncbi:alpha/beta-hydrolase [Corynespora cassiicola Philippines]|uniref:Alpha/beta-hydrolase n=1 Tax=Corynespora cassiicola Philippines TaxID=1448308 RepID=A0A2T2NYM9_CORCC|nr:alpha/beta-hydrolase [Corynespora cassiicola Philippines]